MRNEDSYSMDFEKPLRELERQIKEIELFAKEKEIDMSEEIARLQAKEEALKKKIYSELTRWQKVQIARHPKRPTFLEFVEMIFSGFLELHGDRLFGDDPAMIGGLAYLDGIPVTVVGQQKRSEEHTSELQSRENLVCRLLLE